MEGPDARRLWIPPHRGHLLLRGPGGRAHSNQRGHRHVRKIVERVFGAEEEDLPALLLCGQPGVVGHPIERKPPSEGRRVPRRYVRGGQDAELREGSQYWKDRLWHPRQGWREGAVHGRPRSGRRGGELLGCHGSALPHAAARDSRAGKGHSRLGHGRFEASRVLARGLLRAARLGGHADHVDRGNGPCVRGDREWQRERHERV
mmetsp:Transcript_75809/g.214798  ORF Transcript_75809/g.214798 Transcript_75809/m.214798 type:complete len:204 (+) Transcript_75809:1834-2445(+)